MIFIFSQIKKLCFSFFAFSVHNFLGVRFNKKYFNVKILLEANLMKKHFHNNYNIWWLSVSLKLSCDSRFQRAYTACCCVFKVITLAWANQGNYFENANACCKQTHVESDCRNSALNLCKNIAIKLLCLDHHM